MAQAVEIAIPPKPESSGRARQELKLFRDSLDSERFVDLQLLVSDLIAEAIGSVDTGPHPIKVRGEANERHVRVSVEQGPGAFVVPADSRQPGERGWAVSLVQRVSDSWGVRRTEDHETVWFELARPAERGTDGSIDERQPLGDPSRFERSPHRR
jgi:hypothetical protein